MKINDSLEWWEFLLVLPFYIVLLVAIIVILILAIPILAIEELCKK